MPRWQLHPHLLSTQQNGCTCGKAPLADSFLGPFRILERGLKTFRLQLEEREDHVSRDRLKPHRAKKDPKPAVKRPRGCPPCSGAGAMFSVGD